MKTKLLLMTLALLTALGAAAQGDSWQTATEVNNGQTVNSQLSDTKGPDWYKIVVPDEGIVKVSVATEQSLRAGNIYVYALGADGELHSHGQRVAFRHPTIRRVCARHGRRDRGNPAVPGLFPSFAFCFFLR